jgi:hypothetical protein
MSSQQDRLRARLREEGERRKRGLAAAEQARDAIADLLPAALDAGITKVELSKLTGLTRPTIDALLKRRR